MSESKIVNGVGGCPAEQEGQKLSSIMQVVVTAKQLHDAQIVRDKTLPLKGEPPRKEI